MKKLTLLYIGIFSLLITAKINAQADSTLQIKTKSKSINSYTIAVQPFYLLNGGLMFDFEKQLREPREWLQLSLSGYYLSERDGSEYSYWETMNSNYDNITGLKGIGIGGAYKRLLSPSKSPYFSGGLSYTYYQVDYMGTGYIPYQEDGMTFYKYASFQDTQNFNKLNANICIGLQSSLKHNVFFDAYLGLGYSYSLYDKNKASFDTDIFGYGYRGFTLAGGIRLGFAFGK